MLEHLTKLAARSASLRSAHLRKEAALLGTVSGAAASGAARVGVAGAKFVGNAAINNPGTALGVGLVGAMTPGAVKGTFQKHHAGFDVAAQRALLGDAPKPPGIP